MKKFLFSCVAILFLLSCKNNTDKGKFTVTGEIKNLPDQKIFLEELYFSQRNPEILDTAEIKNGKFIINALAPEEGLFRLRLEKDNTGFIFINDKDKITFSADAGKLSINEQLFSSPVNISLTKFIIYSDSLRKVMDAQYASVEALQQQGVKETDSNFVAAKTNFETDKESLAKYCFKYADTTTDAVLGVFAITASPVDVEKLQLPLEKLNTRFPQNNSVATAITTIKQIVATKVQPQQPVNASATPGAIAPDLTMADTSGKPFSLSSLRGKYVLVDFWASWCGPCRMENPTVVRAYNNYKNKNFTVLGVSLDKDKKAWVNAIHADKLTWQHISDLKFWNSAAVTAYGFESIPYNVLIDPQGKVIATELRGADLENKLAEVLK